MIGSLGSEAKGIRHVRNYIIPYLSKEGRRLTDKNLVDDRGQSRLSYKIGTKSFVLDTDIDGELYIENQPTHRLARNCNTHQIGTEVQVLHLTTDQKKLYAHTIGHGVIPVSALEIPRPIQKQFHSQGFSVETAILQGRGRPRAGAASAGYDFTANGSVSLSESTAYSSKGQDYPAIRGEAKLVSGKMGQSALKWCNGKWQFSGNPKMHTIFKKANIIDIDGKKIPVIKFLNKYHSDGHIDSMLKAIPAKGTSHHYLDVSDINVLHIHYYEKDNEKILHNYGTTYTVGINPPYTSLNHLSRNEIDRLDGVIKIETTSSKMRGKTTMIHRPKMKVMKEYADRSIKDESHRDLTNKEHADEFLRHIEEHLNG